MTWIKLDDRSPRHPKVAGLTDKAFRWWVLAMCYASEFLTNGDLPQAFYKSVPKQVRAELVGAGLWLFDDPNLKIHDYLGHQSSKEAVAKKKADAAERVAKHRAAKAAEKAAKRNALHAGIGNALQDGSCNALVTPPENREQIQRSENREKKEQGILPTAAHPISELLEFHEQLFTRTTGEKPAKYGAKDAKHAKDLIERHGYEKARLIVRQAFVSKAPFIAGAGKSVAFIISSNVQNQLISELAAARIHAAPPVQPSSLRIIDEMEAKRNAS